MSWDDWEVDNRSCWTREIDDAEAFSFYFTEMKATNIHAQDDYNQNLAHVAAKLGLKKELAELIELGVDISIKNTLDETPLYIAISNNKYNCINLLLEAGTKIDYMVLNLALSYNDTPNIFDRAMGTTIIQSLIDKSAESCDIDTITNFIDLLRVRSVKPAKAKKKSIIPPSIPIDYLRELKLPDVYKMVLLLKTNGKAADYMEV